MSAAWQSAAMSGPQLFVVFALAAILAIHTTMNLASHYTARRAVAQEH